MDQFNTFQKYFLEEFYDDYRDGLVSRRTFIRRVAFITGGMASAVATMGMLGCAPIELPDPESAIPAPDTSSTADLEELEPVPDAQSPFSVPEGDPAVASEIATFTSSDGAEIMGYLASPAAEGVYPAILVCHENRGLNPHIEDVARRFAKEGYVALALDLLSREGGTTEYDRDEVPGLLSAAPAERHVADFEAGKEYLKTLANVDGTRLGMTGYCFGGGITWRCATAFPDLSAAAPYYGVAPELDQVPNIQAAVLGVYAELDERINAGKDPLDEALAEAGITYEINVYPGASHAFHNDTNPERYNEEQATQAWQDTLAWFAEYV